MPLRVVGSEIRQVPPTQGPMPDEGPLDADHALHNRLETEVYDVLLVGLYATEDLQEIGRDYREAVDLYLRSSASAAVKAAWRVERDDVERITRNHIEKASRPDMARVQDLLRAQRGALRKQVTEGARQHLREVLRVARHELVRTVDKRTRAIRRTILVTQVTEGAALLVSAATWLARMGAGHT
jgi:hypothetical protein